MYTILVREGACTCADKEIRARLCRRSSRRRELSEKQYVRAGRYNSTYRAWQAGGWTRDPVLLSSSLTDDYQLRVVTVST